MIRYLILIFLLALTPVSPRATTETERYLLLWDYGNGYLWNWSADFPLYVTETMCWDSSDGFACDARFTSGRQMADLIDFEAMRHGGVYRQENGLCYFWWWLPAIGEDAQPHVAEAYWITCPEI